MSYKKEHTDALLKLCVEGKASAQLEIYNRYYEAMFNTSVRIVKDMAEAGCDARIVLSAFTKLLHTFKGEVTFGSWLKRIVIIKGTSISIRSFLLVCQVIILSSYCKSFNKDFIFFLKP